MKPTAKALLRRLCIGLALDVLGAALAFRLSGRWDVALAVGGCLLVGNLNVLFPLYQLRRERLESRSGK